jgi:hypothetical protein
MPEIVPHVNGSNGNGHRINQTDQQLVWNDRSLKEVRNETLAILAKANQPPTLFQQNGRLVRVRRIDERVEIERLSYDALRQKLDSSATFTNKYFRDGKPSTRKGPPPYDFVKDILAMPGWQEDVFPTLRSVTACPVCACSGELHIKPGFIRCRIEPSLYLWGLEITADSFRPWPLLIEARRRFESNLPVERPLTEPDIALHLPGKYLILIEAKFTSSNTCYARGRRQNGHSLTLEELLRIYSDPKHKILDTAKANRAERIFHQLWRNTTFAEWMSRFDHPGTRAYHVNLVRQGHELGTFQEFTGLLQPEFKDRFQRCTWEHIHADSNGEVGLIEMRQYLQSKTAGLKPAFALS